MNDHHDVEERLRAALRARAGDFTGSPDAWQRTLARGGDPTTRLHPGRSRFGMIAPLAAAMAVIAVATGLLIQRGSPPLGPATAGDATPAPTTSGSPPVLPPLSPTHGSLPPGTHVPAACVYATPPPPVYKVTNASAGSMPAPASDWLTKAPPATPVVRVDVTYRGDRALTYLWFTRHNGGPLALVGRIAFLLPAKGANLDTVHWDGGYGFVTAVSAGHPLQSVLIAGNRLVTYEVGLVSGHVASAMVTPFGGVNSIDALSGPTATVPGLVISGHGFPAKVSVSPVPSTPTYGSGRLVARDAAGKVVGTDYVNPASFGDWCTPLVVADRYQEPGGGLVFSTGAALPQVASVTAVLPDGSQLQGGFSGHPEWNEPYYWGWQVRYPLKDASLTVTLLFKDAAGRVLGHFTTVPGQNPYAPVKR
jgi:hypothetical protein